MSNKTLSDYQLLLDVFSSEGKTGFIDLNESEQNEVLAAWIAESDYCEPSEILFDILHGNTLSEFMYGSMTAEELGLKIKNKLCVGSHIKSIDDDIYKAHLKTQFSQRGILVDNECTDHSSYVKTKFDPSFVEVTWR